MFKKTTVFLSFLLGLSLLATPLFAGGGTYTLEIDSWINTGSPRVYETSVLIPPEMDLKVDAGVEVQMAPGTEIIVLGRLTILDDSTDSQKPVIFRSIDETASWEGIKVKGNGDSKGELYKVQIINAVNGIEIDSAFFDMKDVEIFSAQGNLNSRKAISIINDSDVTLNNVEAHINSESHLAKVFVSKDSKIDLMNSQFYQEVHFDYTAGQENNPLLNPILICRSNGKIKNIHFSVVSNIRCEAVTFDDCYNNPQNQNSFLEVTLSSVKLELENASGFSSAITVSDGYVDFDGITLDLRSINSDVAGFYAFGRGHITVINSIISNTKGTNSDRYSPFRVYHASEVSTISCDYSCLYALYNPYNGHAPMSIDEQISIGTSIVYDDPCFENSEDYNYNILEQSSCLDAGTGGNDPDNTIRDIGKSYFHQTQTTSVNESEVPESFKVITAYPNPFNSTTNIGMDLNRSEMVTVVIYDLLGREVHKLNSTILQAGHHEFIWNAGAELASGIYFLKVEAGSKREPEAS